MECPIGDCRQLFDDPDTLNEHVATAHMEAEKHV